jgi:hypothetical protein
VIAVKQTWREKHLAREESGDRNDDAYKDKEENGEQSEAVNKVVGEKQVAHEEKDQSVHGTNSAKLVPHNTRVWM